eukprot:g18754.t1
MGHPEISPQSLSALAPAPTQSARTRFRTAPAAPASRKEFLNLVSDPSIPGALSVILRKYSKRLAEISGTVAQAKMRDDVALSVANYVKLNMTKVGWIADRLGNNSVPLDFSAAVFEVYKLHPEAMTSSVDLMANASWWVSQGFDLKDQPMCVKMATTWLTQAEKKGSKLSLLSLDVSHSKAMELLEALPQAAYVMAEESARLYRLERLQAKQQRRNVLFASETSQMLLTKLLGGRCLGR